MLGCGLPRLTWCNSLTTPHHTALFLHRHFVLIATYTLARTGFGLESSLFGNVARVGAFCVSCACHGVWIEATGSLPSSGITRFLLVVAWRCLFTVRIALLQNHTKEVKGNNINVKIIYVDSV